MTAVVVIIELCKCTKGEQDVGRELIGSRLTLTPFISTAAITNAKAKNTELRTKYLGNSTSIDDIPGFRHHR